MPDQLVSKGVAWVTGAGSGLGRALARRLAQDGWIVAASARTARDIDSLAAEVPGRITSFQLDVTDEKAAEATGKLIEGTLGPVDLAIFSAGSYFPTTARDFSVANFRKTVDVNLMGTVNCMGPVVPSMVARHGGHIAIMASAAGYVGLPNAASYGATKAALINMAEGFKPDFERYGVTLTVINPGYVRTPLTAKNTFPMPFLLDVEDAVDHIMRGLAASRFEIVFPWQVSLSMRLLASLPHWARFALTRRMLPR